MSIEPAYECGADPAAPGKPRILFANELRSYTVDQSLRVGIFSAL